MSKKTIEKIRKLLSLSKSDNINEAAAALKNAMKLCGRIGVDVRDIEITSGETIESLKLKENKSSIERDEWSFITKLSEIFGCSAVRDSRYVFLNGGYRKRYDLRAVGYESDLEIFEYLCAYLMKEISSLTAAYMKGSACGYNDRTKRLIRKSYRHGLMGAVISNAQKMFEEESSEVKEQYAVVLKRGEAVLRSMENIIYSKPRGSYINSAAVSDGKIDGHNILIRKGVSKSSETSQRLIR